MGALRALWRDDLLHGADGDPRLHEVGGRVPERTTCRRCACSGTVGEPINPKAWLWYRKVIGGERCPIVDTWWQTETGHIMITTLPGARRRSPARHAAAARDRRRRWSTTRATRSTAAQGLLVLHAAVAGHAADAVPGRRSLRRDLLLEVRPRLPRRRRRAPDEDGYFWVIGRIDDVINVSGHRLSTAEVESAIVSHPKVAEAAVIGQADEDTGQAICAFVTLEGDLEGTDELVASCASTSPRGSASSRGRSG